MTIPFPTPDDPVIVTTFDRTMVVCWIDVPVEAPSGAVWFAQTSDGGLLTLGATLLHHVHVKSWWSHVVVPEQPLHGAGVLSHLQRVRGEGMKQRVAHTT